MQWLHGAWASSGSVVGTLPLFFRRSYVLSTESIGGGPFFFHPRCASHGASTYIWWCADNSMRSRPVGGAPRVSLAVDSTVSLAVSRTPTDEASGPGHRTKRHPACGALVDGRA